MELAANRTPVLEDLPAMRSPDNATPGTASDVKSRKSVTQSVAAHRKQSVKGTLVVADFQTFRDEKRGHDSRLRQNLEDLFLAAQKVVSSPGC